jgi:hypothetical protein
MSNTAEFLFGPQDRTIVLGLNPTNVGEFSSTVAGSGVAVSATRTKALDVCADDNNTTLAAGSYRATRNRFLITKAIAGADVSIDGDFGHVKIAGVDLNSVGTVSGCDGYIECTATASIHSTGAVIGVRGRIDLPSGAVNHGSYPLGAFGTFYDDLGGTHTTPVVLFNQGPLKAGTWDAFANFTATGGCIATTAGGSATQYLVVMVDGTKKKIALLETA